MRPRVRLESARTGVEIARARLLEIGEEEAPPGLADELEEIAERIGRAWDAYPVIRLEDVEGAEWRTASELLADGADEEERVDG